MDEKKRRNILILDPERDSAELFMRALEAHGSHLKCYWVKTSQEARSLVDEISFAVLLADFSSLELEHFLLLEKTHDMPTRVIVNGYLHQMDDMKKALPAGACGYFIKPIMINSLRRLIDDLIDGSRVKPTPVMSG